MNEQGYNPKQLAFGEDGRQKLLSGIEKMARAVKSTLGSNGNTVLIESPEHTHGMTVTFDGVTVAKAISFIDPIENLAATMMKAAAERTATEAGDGPQDLDSLILTPTGWVRMGDIKVGDKICGTNRSIQTVLGVYPKGKKVKHNVYLSGGAIVSCCLDHLWDVNTNWGIQKILPLSEINKDYKQIESDNSIKHKYYVKPTIVEFNECKELLTIDPYFLGVLLGDGSLSGTHRGSIEIAIGKKKEHILSKLVLPEGVIMRATWVDSKNYFRVKFTGTSDNNISLRTLLSQFGLLGVTSKDKFIPKEYLYSSKETREKLLQGLLDTDGHINKRRLFEFTTMSDKLATDIVDLCKSLGKQISRQIKDQSKSKGYSQNNINYIYERKGYDAR